MMPTPNHHTRRRQIVASSLMLGTLGLSTGVFANGTRLPNQNAEATARGNAFVATADNPSAIYYNPAGLTQLPGVQLQAESYVINARYDYESPLGDHVKAKRDYAVVPQFYSSFTPENSPLSYGLGAYAPFGQASEWPDDSGFGTIATRNEITFITIAPTIAWKISESLSIGAGLQINDVETDLRRNVPGGEFRFEGDDTSFGYNIGVMWRLNERHVFGLNYQSRSTSKFKGTASIDAFGLSSPGSVDLDFPDVIALGYSYRPTPEWNFEFAVDRTNWDLLDTAELEAGPFMSASIPFNWKASYYYTFGVTRHLANGWRVSAGYCYSENSVPDATFNPAVPDVSRHLASVGVGRTIGKFTGYFTYQHGFKATRSVNGSPTNVFLENADGRYENALDAINLSLRYVF